MQKPFTSASSRFPPGLLFLVLLAGATLTLWPGVHGGFLFDDYPNFKSLAELGGIDDWQAFRTFVFDGFSGPTGRPVAMASFLINSNVWPAPAFSFKYTNLLLHLLSGVFLTWASLQLCRFYGIEETQAQYFALFNAAVWLLHPLLISTTFYVVQRMAQLAALFCFAGIAAYLHGRRLAEYRPRAGYLWMAGAIGLGTLLAALSKENGALLPLLVLIIEFCRPRGAKPLDFRFRVSFLYLPSLAILAYLASKIDFSDIVWTNRTFNQPERLLTEARILWEYLGKLLLPQIEGAGLYQDGRVVSESWLNPPSTLLSVIALAGLIAVALYLRRRLPLLALAILFFLAGHLVESTVIGLELYFEHRNYLPSAFLFLPLAQGLAHLPQSRSGPVRTLAVAMIIGTLVFLSHQRALLWGSPVELDLYWATAAPNSPRAQNTLASHHMLHGDFDAAEKVLVAAAEKRPDSPLLTLSLLLLKVKANSVQPGDFSFASARLGTQVIDGQAIGAVRKLVDLVLLREPTSWIQDATLEFVDSFSEMEGSAENHFIQRLVPYLKAKLYMLRGEEELAERHYAAAIELYDDIDAAMQMVAEMALAEEPARALSLLATADRVFGQQADESLRFSRDFYREEISRVRTVLREHIEQNGEIGRRGNP